MLLRLIFNELPTFKIISLMQSEKTNHNPGVDCCLKYKNVYNMCKIINCRESERWFYTKTKRVFPQQRIRPECEEIIFTLLYSLLGDGWAKKRINGTKFYIDMESPNRVYVDWLDQFFVRNGFWCPEKVIPREEIGKERRIYFSSKLRTCSYSTLNWLYDLFYNKKKKIIPKNISQLLTPKTLAALLMDDPGINGGKVKISTKSFIYQEIVVLQTALKKRYSLMSTIQYHQKEWIISFPLNQLPSLSKIVKTHMIPSIYYKLNNH